MDKGILHCAEVQTFEELCCAKYRDIEKVERRLESIYSAFEPDLFVIKKAYRGFLEGMIKKKDKKRVKIVVGIKSFDSLCSKVIERQKKLSEIKDLVRATILLSSDDEVKKLYRDITRKKLEVIRCQHKHKGGDSLFGYYGAYHIIFFYRGLNVELQIMTRRLWSYKEVAHDLYNRYRDEESSNIDKSDLQCCKFIFSKGNQPKHQYKRSEVRQNYRRLISRLK